VILYLDTSSLVKLYIDEAGADFVRGLVVEAEFVATCRIAYPEAYSAFTRRFRAGEMSAEDYEKVLAAFLRDWPHFVILDFDELAAAQFVRRHALRGFDAVHLSSAFLLTHDFGQPEVLFSSFDTRLATAAGLEGFQVMSLPATGWNL
jgi:predicted nucleic acid-binding protein